MQIALGKSISWAMMHYGHAWESDLGSVANRVQEIYQIMIEMTDEVMAYLDLLVDWMANV